MQKALFALAALVATALMVALAWGIFVLMTGPHALPRWAMLALFTVVVAAGQIVRWRRRRRHL